MDTIECAHAPCRCVVAHAQMFCSARCTQLHDAGARDACPCGHAECRTAMQDRTTAGAEDESTADASLGPGDPRRRGGTREP